MNSMRPGWSTGRSRRRSSNAFSIAVTFI
jgi:hypothetical protein